MPSEPSAEQWSAHECKKPRQAGTPPDGGKARSSALARPIPGLYYSLGGGGGCPARCRVFTSIRGPYPLVDTSTPSHDNQLCLLGGELSPAGNHWIRGSNS